MACSQPIDLELLQSSLAARCELGRRVILEECCESTHQTLRRQLKTAAPNQLHGLLVLAEQQTAGKGRRQPDWWSGPTQKNLAISLLLSPPVLPLETLGLHAACALADAIQPLLARASGSAQKSELALKWPNDVLLNGAKVAGILVETSEQDGQGYALLGVGVNVLAAPPAGIAPYPTTALVEHCPALEPSDRAELGDRPAHELQTCRSGLPPTLRTRFLAAWLWALEKRLLFARRNGTEQLEKDYLPLLQKWAPHGVSEPTTEMAGPVLEFSVQRGLTWGHEGSKITRPLGWIPTLKPLPAPPSA